MNYIQNDILDSSKKEALAKKFGLSTLLVEILVNRGFDNEDKIEKFLNVDEKQLNNPFLLRNMDELCNRIKLAINKNESIVIFGDYDVDGISASYILFDYLKSLNANVNYFLPCRIAEGYGLTKNAIEQVNNKFAPNLIVTVDCGISCREEVEFAKTLGIEILVTDHHEIPENAPDFFVNAKFENQDYPFRNLCGAGLALKIVHALGGENAMHKYLPVAAVATVADIVPLVEENRAIVKLGLKEDKLFPAGIKKLIKECGITKLTSKEISFKLAPKINAPGRMGDASVAIKLYIEKDMQQIDKLIDEIFRINEKRQQLCNEMFAECEELLKAQDLKNKRIIILKSPNQDKGLLGIIAARIAGEFGRPAIIFNVEGEILKGSCRSVEGINCVALFESVSHLLDGFGGHSMAGGLSLQACNYDEFCVACEKFVNDEKYSDVFKTQQQYDLAVNINKLNFQFAKELELLEPTGCDNKQPQFLVNFSQAKVSQSKNYPNHFFAEIGGKDFVAFNFLGFYDSLKAVGKKSAIVQIGVETFRGKTDVKCYLKRVDLIDFPSIQDFRFYHISNLELQKNEQSIRKLSKQEVVDLFNDRLGNLFIAGSEDECKFAIENCNNLPIFNFKLNEISPSSAILCAPNGNSYFEFYKRIVFLGKPKLELVKNLDAEICYCDDVDEGFNFKVYKNRELFADIFALFKKQLSEKQNYVDEKEFLSLIKHKNFVQTAFCFYVFKELEIITTKRNGVVLEIKIDKTKKAPLTDSYLYKTFAR